MPKKASKWTGYQADGKIKVGEPTVTHKNDWSAPMVGSGNRTVKAGKRVWEFTEAVRGFQKKL